MGTQEPFQRLEACILSNTAPAGALRLLAAQPWFGTFPFSLLQKLQTTPQSPVHHPEGSVWNHTLLVLDEAAKLRQYSADPRAFLWAALLHDIGKPAATRVRRGKITAYDHDRKGEALARQFLSALTDEAAFIDRTALLVRYHMQLLYVTRALPFQDIPGMQTRTSVREVALLGYCDRLGRTGADPAEARAAVSAFLRACGERPDPPWLTN